MNMYKIWILNVVLFLENPLFAMDHNFPFQDEDADAGRTSSEDSLSILNDKKATTPVEEFTTCRSDDRYGIAIMLLESSTSGYFAKTPQEVLDDFKEAQRLLEELADDPKASDSNKIDANIELGLMYQYDTDKVEKDLETALAYFEKAGSDHHRDLLLKEEYENVLRLQEKQEFQEAKNILDWLVGKDYGPASHLLGQMHEEGKYGVEQDLDAAYEAYYFAYQHGHRSSLADADRITLTWSDDEE